LSPISRLSDGAAWTRSARAGPGPAAPRASSAWSINSAASTTAFAHAARLAKLDPAKTYPLFIEREPNPFKAFVTDFFRNDGAGEQAAVDPWSKLARGSMPCWPKRSPDARLIASGPAIQVRCLECPATRWRARRPTPAF
jgi:hypothetical protein